jgi:branched-chain amino acid aminotransferase
MAFINLNSNLIPESELVIDIHNRAFRYGDGIFESMRVNEGALFFAPFHSARLSEALDLLNMQLPVTPTEDFLSNEVLKLCRINRHQSARVRMQVWREGQGLYAPSASHSSFCISSSHLPDGGYLLSDNYVKLCIYENQKKTFGNLSSIKSCSALLYVLASSYAAKNGCDEAIILNNHNRVAEASSSNIWFVKNQEWHTPALSEAGVDGVMRRVLLQLLMQQGIQVSETVISLDDIHQYDYVLLTNASRGLRIVHQIEDWKFKTPSLNELLWALNEFARYLK